MSRRRSSSEDTLGLQDKFDFHKYRHMERLIGTVEHDNAVSQLWLVIKGKGAFRYFKVCQASSKLNGHPLAEAVDGFLNTAATVKRLDLGKPRSASLGFSAQDEPPVHRHLQLTPAS